VGGRGGGGGRGRVGAAGGAGEGWAAQECIIRGGR